MYKHYEIMLPKSNQPGKIYGTAKTHKFNSIEDITLENLKFHPIVAQSIKLLVYKLYLYLQHCPSNC